MSLAVTAAGEATRDRILRLADALFAEHGYARVSMRLVATAAGVTKPALYYHFRNKDALFEECVLGTQKRMGEMLRSASGSAGSLDDRVTAVAQILLTGSPHHPVLIQNDIAEHLPAEVRERLDRGFQENVIAPLAGLFADAGTRGELRPDVSDEMAASSILGVCMAFLPVAPPGNAVAAVAPTAGMIADVVLHGVSGRPAAP
ncbi:MAG TPA: helix-turn-helix domain-containing protein [Candidatus Dormibacteraeota bacterium]|nr:helix-turn-helix domain-containing protein [Candidatus Dormibacteraeota bacterium]